MKLPLLSGREVVKSRRLYLGADMVDNKGKTIVVKIGGSTLGSGDTALEDLVVLQRRGMQPVVVHGGGKLISEWLAKHGVPTRFVRGLRVTDAETLGVVTAVLAGLVNKELVAAITSRGGKAVGLSGADGALLKAAVKDPALGYAGEITEVDLGLLQTLLAAGYMPIVAPVSLLSSSGLGSGVMLANVNGDTAAGEIAAALGAERLVFLTDVAGICDSSSRLIPFLSPAEARALISSGVAAEGMIPKIEACLKALSTVKVVRVIDGRIPHVLLQDMEGGGGGTRIG